MKKSIIPIIVAIIAIILFGSALVLMQLDKTSFVKECNTKIATLNEEVKKRNDRINGYVETNAKKDEMAIVISEACANTLKDILGNYVNRNLNVDADNTFRAKYITNNMYRKVAQRAIYMDGNGNRTANSQNASVIAYLLNNNDGLLNTTNSSYGKLKLIAFDDNTALTSIDQSNNGVTITYYPVFVKDGENWKLETY